MTPLDYYLQVFIPKNISISRIAAIRSQFPTLRDIPVQDARDYITSEAVLTFEIPSKK